MGNNQNDYKWNAELILADTLDNVLKNLNARDLCRVAQVCKSWNYAVHLEFSRRGPERILIPSPHNRTLEDSEFHVANIFSVKPNIVILFCGPEPHFRSKFNLEVDVLSAYNNQLPDGTRLLVVGVDHAMKDESEIIGCPDIFQLDKSDVFNILGLALSNYRNIEIEVAYCESNESKSSSLAQLVAQKLRPDRRVQKSILLMFGRSEYSVSRDVLKIIKNTWKNRKYTVWGGTTQNYLKIISCKSGDFPKYQGMQGVICISITGQDLEAYTTVVSNSTKMADITKKLLEFKSRLTLRRHKLGLVFGTCFSVRNNVLLKIIKSIFLEIPFTSIFSDNQLCFGLDSTSDDSNQKLIHRQSMSIMILTYN